MRIQEIFPKDDWLIYIRSDDGRAGFFDVKPYLDSEAFAPLKNWNEFKRVHNRGYYIEWECGADFSADTIEARWNPAAKNAQQGLPADARTSRG